MERGKPHLLSVKVRFARLLQSLHRRCVLDWELPAFCGHYSEWKKESSNAQVKGAVPGGVLPTNGGVRPRGAQARVNILAKATAWNAA